MELRIKPAANNQYERRALLIKGAEPLIWFREMEALNIPVSDIEAFAIPSGKVNVLYGCLLVFRKGLPKDTRDHKRFQCAHNKLFIPENAALYPQLTPADIASVKVKWIIAHPDFGFVDLETPINWLELIAEVPQTGLQLRQPLEGVITPDKIVSYAVELDEEDIANSLLPQKTEEAWMKELPFNLQKVLNGNKKEAEKYLKYLAQYPERALALGIPLDIMSTSRDSGWAPFSFRSGWLQSVFGGSGFGGSGGSGGSGSSSSFGSGRRRPLSGEVYMKSIFIGIVVFLLLAKLFSAEESTPAPSRNHNSAPEKGLYHQYKEPLIVPQKTVASEPDNKDTLDEKSATLHSKYLAAVYKYASQEVQVDPGLKDSIRLQIDELKRQIESVSAKIAARNAVTRNANLKKVEEELAQVEKRLGAKIRDSIAQLPQQDTQNAGGRNVLYQLALESKKAQLRDSLELAYGLRAVQQDTFTPTTPDIPSQQVQEPRDGLVGQIIFVIFVFLFVVLIFTKMIRGKTISMGGRQVSFGVKALLLLAFIGLLVYILYPLIDRYGYNWLVGLVLLVAAGLLYRLLASDKTILKSGKNG